MTNSQVIHGAVPSAAPRVSTDELQGEIDHLGARLVEIRKTMTVAKARHEANLLRARNIRKELSELERENISSEYEMLVAQESDLRNQMQRLATEKNSTRKGGA